MFARRKGAGGSRHAQCRCRAVRAARCRRSGVFREDLLPGADQGAAKPFTLFVTALREGGRCTVGRWANHRRDHVVILRPIDNALALHQLHFAPQVQSVAVLGVESAKVRDAELKLARQLIERQSAETFDPAAFPDEVKARVEAAIHRKVEGKEVTVAEPGGERGRPDGRPQGQPGTWLEDIRAGAGG